MPDDLGRGDKLEGCVKIFDQFEHKHSAKIFLRVDRETERIPKLNPRRQGLFARRDSEARSESEV